MIEAVGRIADAVDLPVTADLEAGYGDPGGTIARAIDVGIVGANLEDQLNPLPDAVRAVSDAVARPAGIPFVSTPHRRLPRGRRDPVACSQTRRTRTPSSRPALDVLRTWSASRRGSLAVRSTMHLAARLGGCARRVVRPVEPERRAHRAGRTCAADVRAGGGIPENTRKLN